MDPQDSCRKITEVHLQRYIPSQKSFSLKVSFGKSVSAIYWVKIGSYRVFEESAFLKLPTLE